MQAWAFPYLTCIYLSAHLTASTCRAPMKWSAVVRRHASRQSAHQLDMFMALAPGARRSSCKWSLKGHATALLHAQESRARAGWTCPWA